MTIQKDGGMFHVLCDQCSDSDELMPEDEPFKDAVHTLKEIVYRAYLVNNEWTHLCMACRQLAKEVS